MKKLHHIISAKGDLYLTDEEYREFFNLDLLDIRKRRREFL